MPDRAPDCGALYYADTAQWGARGSNMANTILANVNAPASSAWLTPTVLSNSYTGSPGSPTVAGANIVGSYDTSGTAVANRLGNETWAQANDETRDATSGAVGGYWYACNFSSCSSYAL